MTFGYDSNGALCLEIDQLCNCPCDQLSSLSRPCSTLSTARLGSLSAHLLWGPRGHHWKGLWLAGQLVLSCSGRGGLLLGTLKGMQGASPSLVFTRHIQWSSHCKTELPWQLTHLLEKVVCIRIELSFMEYPHVPGTLLSGFCMLFHLFARECYEILENYQCFHIHLTGTVQALRSLGSQSNLKAWIIPFSNSFCLLLLRLWVQLVSSRLFEAWEPQSSDNIYVCYDA